MLTLALLGRFATHPCRELAAPKTSYRFKSKQAAVPIRGRLFASNDGYPFFRRTSCPSFSPKKMLDSRHPA